MHVSCMPSCGSVLLYASHQVFSRAGNLSDPNLGVPRLARMVMAAVNKNAFKPTVDAIKDMYFKLFRGKGGPGIDEEAGPSGS